MKHSLLALAALAAFSPVVANATPFTETSPLGGAVPTGVTPVGGLVLDLEGLNGTRVFAQAAASSLFVGTQGVTNQTIGSISGFNATILSALGGGLSRAALRVTLDDGDSAAGEFNFNESTILVDGVSFGNVSSVDVQRTNSLGTMAISTGVGFRNSLLDTGWFTLLGASELSALFLGLGDGTATFVWTDSQLDGNFLDFTQGVDGGLINVGTGPVVSPPAGTPVPEPGTLMTLGAGLAGLAALKRRRRKA
jgi:hypothetical protein